MDVSKSLKRYCSEDGPLNIDMAFLSAIGDWLEVCG